MASYRLIFQNLCKQYNKFLFTEPKCGISRGMSNGCSINILQHSYTMPILNCLRFSHSFVSRLTADQIWKGVTSVSPAGRKKGRGRGTGRKFAKDLNRGQIIGCGKKNMLWPGLNAAVVQGKEIIRQQELPPDENREKRIFELRDKMKPRKFLKVHPLERGWSGNKLPGRSLGPPDPVGEETFPGFDSRVLEFKPVMHMTGKKGRVRSLSALVVVGNKNGLGGFAMAKSGNGNTAAKSAKNRAAKVLRYIERDNNTVVHDFYSEFGPARIFVKRKPEGYGLVCHRGIRAICEVLGIKDLWAKVEGSAQNYQCVTRAFFIGLMKQKSFQQIANEKGLYVVERRRDRDYFPVVVAAPENCRTEEEIGPTELLDFELHLHQNKVEEARKKFQPFYVNFPSYIKEMKDRAYLRNQGKVRLHLLAKYGKVQSFLQVREEEKAKKELKENVES